jgi:hypothetical protein
MKKIPRKTNVQIMTTDTFYFNIGAAKVQNIIADFFSVFSLVQIASVSKMFAEGSKQRNCYAFVP